MNELKHNVPKTLLDYDSTDENKSLIGLEDIDDAEDTYKAPKFIAQIEIIENIFDASKYDKPEEFNISDIFEHEPQYVDESEAIASDKVILKGWKNVENVSARLIDKWEDQVLLECLIDKEQKIYEERVFRSSLFEGYNLEPGNRFFIRFFERPNELKMEVHDDPGLTSEDDFPKTEFAKQFKNNKLFK